MPGRIGLVAVDALCLGWPVLTTEWPFHAPEIEYLEEGDTMFSSANDPAAFAALILNRSKQRQDLDMPRENKRAPQLADMVSNFSGGVRKMLSS